MLFWTGGIVAIASPAVFHAVQSIRKSFLNTFQLSFSGPFTPCQNLLKSSVGTRWFEFEYLEASAQNPSSLRAAYTFKGTKDPKRRIRVLVSAVAKDGSTHTLLDKEMADPRCEQGPVWGASSPVYHASDCIFSVDLPMTADNIATLNLRFENLGG
jgi:hypothetical protein